MAPSGFSAYRTGPGSHELFILKYQENKSLSEAFWVYLWEENCIANRVLLLAAIMLQEFMSQGFRVYTLKWYQNQIFPITKKLYIFGYISHNHIKPEPKNFL